MANLTDTQRLAAITKASNYLIDKGEFRDYQHSATKALLAGENEVFRNLNAMKQSDVQPTKVDLNKRVYTASGTAKSASHAAAAFPDSFVKDITYVRLTQKFKVSYKQADMNRLSYEDILSHELRNKLISLYTDLSTANIAWLNSSRSQVGSDGLMTFDETTNLQYDNVLADKEVLFDYVKATQKLNKYNGQNTVMVGDQRTAALYRKLASNGTMNADNTAFQIPGIELHEEPQMAIGANSTSFVWEKGLAGMTTWNEPLNRRGHGSAGSNEGLFTTMVDPTFGFDLDVHVINQVADTSGAGGNVQDVVDEYEIALTYALEGSWLDSSTESHIFKVVQANS
ncbi:virion structural protein [Polaribacter phage P12002L]|uniref:Major capsid protein n=2 Tax=Incheonvirus TaxID=2976977 RepID=A0A0F7IN85_9CAUD|nr:virion structural protein [Polaribacter phage P12002S]YP_009209677.1 virion structural protein [Polaribacter phage P12002L]AKG94191.1 hypothetical protein P12002L_0017 [Polaribacter phage P12002L]AKG94273.1 hypothetical protein P12002S_0017 [Polaribacter phage P12002S]